jgi:hypothetical protein
MRRHPFWWCDTYLVRDTSAEVYLTRYVGCLLLLMRRGIYIRAYFLCAFIYKEFYQRIFISHFVVCVRRRSLGPLIKKWWSHALWWNAGIFLELRYSPLRSADLWEFQCAGRWLPWICFIRAPPLSVKIEKSRIDRLLALMLCLIFLPGELWRKFH